MKESARIDRWLMAMSQHIGSVYKTESEVFIRFHASIPKEHEISYREAQSEHPDCLIYPSKVNDLLILTAIPA